MSFSEIFIRRPVLSTVVSFLILLLGAQGITSMSIRQYPKVDETVITVTTAYPGASSDVIQGFITTTIAKSVSSAEGADYVTSKSALGLSTVQVFMRLNADPNKSLTEVIAKVQQVRGLLPSDAKDPVIQKGTGFTIALNVSRGAQRHHEPAADHRLSDPGRPAAPGRRSKASPNAQILGGRTSLCASGSTRPDGGARRDRDRCARRDRANNFPSAPGKMKNDFVSLSLEAQTSLDRRRILRRAARARRGDAVVRLRDVAQDRARAADRRFARLFQRAQGRRLHRHLPDAGSQPARPSSTGCARRCRRSYGQLPPGMEANRRLRFDQLHPRLDPRGRSRRSARRRSSSSS